MGKVGGHRLDRDLSPPSSLHLDAHTKYSKSNKASKSDEGYLGKQR